MVEQQAINKIYRKKKRTVTEMRLTAQIGAYEIDQIILDLGSDANVLPKQTWQCMGEPNFEWSIIQMHMDNNIISLLW